VPRMTARTNPILFIHIVDIWNCGISAEFSG
jgi:hypothetical protein